MPAPTFTNLTGSGASSATSFATASVSPTGNQLILVTIHAYISTGSAQPAQPAVTGNGITYTLVHAQDVDAAGTDRATMWIFRGMAASPSAGAITIDFGAVTMTRCQWSVDQSDANVDTTGTNGSGAIVQTTGVTTASGATSGSVNYVSAMTAGNSGFSGWGHQVQEAKTPRASWTEVADVITVTLASVETQYIAGTDTAGSASWATGSRAGGIIVEVKASAGGDATATPAVIVVSVAAPQAATAGDANATPVPIAAAVTAPGSDRNTGAGPAVVSASVAVPQATPQTAGNATAAPAATAVNTTLPQAGASAGAGPVVTTVAVSLPQAVAGISGAAAPAMIPVTVTLPPATRNTTAGPVSISTAVTLPSAGESVGAGPTAVSVTVALPQAVGVDEGAQVNGTSTSSVTGLASIAQVSALAAVAAVTQRDSSTPTVSDG